MNVSPIVLRLEAIEVLLTDLQRLVKEQTLLQKEVLNFKEACAYLDVSASHLYKLTSAREIPHYCPLGKKLSFNRKKLDMWLQRNYRPSKTEIEGQAIDFVVRRRRGRM